MIYPYSIEYMMPDSSRIYSYGIRADRPEVAAVLFSEKFPNLKIKSVSMNEPQMLLDAEFVQYGSINTMGD
jgi:hypothetical protein